MGEIYNQFLKELQALREKHSDNPQEELNQLLLLALEREELVATSYQESILRKSILNLKSDDAFKRIFRHGFIWIWKDEEMHTDYVRSGLLKSNKRFSSFKVFFSQFQGYVGGWSGSILQLSSFRKSPFAYLAAKMFMWLGTFGGKIPKEIRERLNAGSLKDFCAFNVDAERTAWACWDRIVMLAQDDARFDEKQIRDFKRIVLDESNHGKIFKIFYDALEHDGTLKSNVTIESIVEQVGAVSDYFLPREYRLSMIHNPIGQDRKVYCQKDDTNIGRLATLEKTIEDAKLKEELTVKAGALNKPISDLEVVIKLTITMGYTHQDVSPIIDKDSIENLIEILRKLGIEKIKLLDVQSIYAKFYDNRTIGQIAKYFNYPDVEIIDATSDLVAHEYDRGIGVYHLSETWKNAEFRICLGKLRSHPTEIAMMSVANLEWLVGNIEDFVFIDKIVDRSATTMVLLDEYPPDFSVVDAYRNIPDGLVGVMGGKNVIHPLRYYASKDCVSLDLAILKHLTIANPPPESLLKTIEYWFGGTNKDIILIGNDTKIDEWRGPTRNFFWSFLNFVSYPVYKFFSNRGSLFLPNMDLVAFPLKEKASLFTRWARKLNQYLIGLR